MYEGAIVGEVDARGATSTRSAPDGGRADVTGAGSSGGSCSRAGCRSPCRSGSLAIAFVAIGDRPGGDGAQPRDAPTGGCSTPPSSPTAPSPTRSSPPRRSPSPGSPRRRHSACGSSTSAPRGSSTSARSVPPGVALYLAGAAASSIPAMVVAGAARSGRRLGARSRGCSGPSCRTNEIITSLMLNYVAALGLTYLINIWR